MGDTGWKLFLIMSDHNEGLSWTIQAELHYNLPNYLSISVIKTVKGFVENEKLWVFHKGSSQETKALLAATELEE